MDPDVKRWYDAMCLKNRSTADERLRVLSRYCEAARTTPGAILALAQEKKGIKKVADDLQDFATLLAQPHEPQDHAVEPRGERGAAACARGHSAGYIEQFVKSVRSFLRANDVPLVRAIAVGDSGATPTVADERIPTPADLRKVLLGASPRGKVIVAFCGLSGVRPEVLGLKDCSDGLRLGDMPDVVVKEGTVKVRRTPAAVRVRRSLSKVRKAYYTFLPREACDFLRTYLASRLAHGEALGPESPVVRPDYGRERQGRPEAIRGSPFLGRGGVTKEIRSALEGAGIHVRPYALRSYFASALLSAEREGLLTDLEREFFLGRANAITLRYTLHKDLPPQAVEELRESFRRCEPFLTTRVVETTSPDQATIDELRTMFEKSQADMKALEARLAGPRSELAEALLADPEARRVLERAASRAKAKRC